MPTPILPTKTQLAGLQFTPKQLVADKTVEEYLTITNNYDFILKLIAQYRSGARASWAGTGVTPDASTYTEFVYFCDLDTLNLLIEYLTNVDYGYGYVVKVAKTSVGWETRTTAISVTPSDSYILPTGNNAGKYAMLVSWA